jgi:hypothetical protein
MGGLIPRDARDVFDRAAITDAIARRLYPDHYAPQGTPIVGVELRVLPLDADRNPLPDGPVHVLSGLAEVWREVDLGDHPVDFEAEPVAIPAESRPRLRLHWVDQADGTSFRLDVERLPGRTLSGEQVAELRRLADTSIAGDEWSAADGFDALAAAVLRILAT